MSNGRTVLRWGLILLAVFIAVMLILAGWGWSRAYSQDVVAIDVCAPCTHKWEWKGGWVKEYGDATAWVTGDEREVCWHAAEGCEVTDVCIKRGTELSHPAPVVGCWTAGDYDLSHIVLCVECDDTPTPTSTSTPTNTPTSTATGTPTSTSTATHTATATATGTTPPDDDQFVPELPTGYLVAVGLVAIGLILFMGTQMKPTGGSL